MDKVVDCIISRGQCTNVDACAMRDNGNCDLAAHPVVVGHRRHAADGLHYLGAENGERLGVSGYEA